MSALAKGCKQSLTQIAFKHHLLCVLSSLTERVEYNTTLHGCSASVLSVQFDSNVRNDVPVCLLIGGGCSLLCSHLSPRANIS